MTAEAIVHQNFAAIVFVVEENALIGGAVRAGLPVCEFGLMALFAAANHFENVSGAELWRFGHFPAEMGEYPAHVVRYGILRRG